jgi:hypothetical protein
VNRSTGLDDGQSYGTSLHRIDSKLQFAIWIADKRSQMQIRHMSQSVNPYRSRANA